MRWKYFHDFKLRLKNSKQIIDCTLKLYIVEKGRDCDPSFFATISSATFPRKKRSRPLLGGLYLHKKLRSTILCADDEHKALQLLHFFCHRQLAQCLTSWKLDIASTAVANEINNVLRFHRVTLRFCSRVLSRNNA